MKIAHVVSTFPPYEGGMGNVCYNQSLQLAQLGHEVTVFLPLMKDSFHSKVNEVFKIKYLKPIFSIGNASFIPQLTNELVGFDIIHLHYPFFGGDVFVKKAAKKNNIPFVVTYHLDIYGDKFFRASVFKIYNFLFQKAIMLNAKRVIGLTSGHIDNSQVAYLNKISNKIAIIPNGVNLKDFADFPTEDKLIIRDKYNIKKDRAVIIFIGALDRAHYFKRLDLLFLALKRLKDRVHLLIIGEGNLKKYYEQLAYQMKLKEDITFIGKVKNQEIGMYLIQSDFLVLPSDNESFGIVLIEAMACKKTVIATNLPAIKSIIKDEKNGLLFKKGNEEDLAEKIEILAKHKDYTRKLGEAGFEVVRNKFTWFKVAKNLEELYLSIINKKSFKVTT